MDAVGDHEWGVVHAWPDRAIARLAARQDTMVTRQQLLELGVDPHTIQAALDRGRLHRVHRGVYSLVMPGARPRLAAERAALLACGPHAVLSHHSAAKLLGLRVAPGPGVALTIVGGDRGRRRRGLEVHRSATLDRADRARAAGMPVTSIVRTVIDVSVDLSDRGTEHLLDQALRRVSITAVATALERHPRRAGTASLRRLLDPERPSSDTWSQPEERLRRLLRRAGLPSPESNVPIGGLFPDLLFRDQRVIVEYDSYDFHSGPGAFHTDRERHNTFTAQGYFVLHVTWRELRHHPERVLAQIAAALTRGGGW